MNQIVLKRLMEEQDYPCISVLLPTYKTAPGYHQNGIILKKLVRDAEDRLQKELSKKEAQPYIDKLKSLTEEVDISKTTDGLALFVNNNYSEKIDLPFPVRERVVIDKTFATRDIIMTINRGLRYYTLVLSLDAIRLLQCDRDQVVEVTQNGFPMKSDLELYELNPSDLSREKEKKVKEFFRHASKALNEFYKADKQGLVVMGVEKNLGFFREVTNLGEHIIASVEGNYMETSAHDIGKKVWPLVKETLSKKRNARLDDLHDAVSSGKYVSDIIEVWHYANEGRISTLIAEENYQQSCLLNDNNSITPIEKPVKGMIDDAVDEVAEIVISKGGNVVFVDDGLLKDFNRIAAILRY